MRLPPFSKPLFQDFLDLIQNKFDVICTNEKREADNFSLIDDRIACFPKRSNAILIN